MMVRMATDVQYYIFQGNATNSGGTSSNEGGNYNADGFDGLRGVLGGYGSFSGNNAIQVDIASLNMLESLQYVAGKAGNNGGAPSLAFMSMNAKEALDQEQQTNVRYTQDLDEIIPGTRVNKVTWADGQLAIFPCPGNTLGSYNRTSDSASVEDLYVVDESTLTLRWLYSENFTVLELPPGYDNTLSSKYIIFGMFGLELAAPLYCGKARKLAS